MTVALAPTDLGIPYKFEWTLSLYRVGQYWAFDMPEYDVECELLCGGTEKLIDHYAGDHDTVDVTLSLECPEECDTQLKFMCPDVDDEYSSWYTDLTTGLPAWFCPFLWTLWQHAPLDIWVTFHYNEQVIAFNHDCTERNDNRAA